MNGVESEEGYKIRIIRRIVSLKICCTGWIYEMLGTLFTALTPLLHEGGIHNIYFVDATMMFVGIQLVHIINDEDTKTVITEAGWYQALRSLF